MFRKFAVVAVLMATVAMPALSQGLNRRADLVSPQSGHADPGDVVMEINVTEALPNVFGAPSIFGRRRPAGRTVVQYLGVQNEMVYFSQQSVAISSNQTTMSRQRIFIPHPTGDVILGPRPHSESQVGLTPLTISVKVGGLLRVTGHELRVLRVNSDGSIDYAAN
jgi:hypothetical protein